MSEIDPSQRAAAKLAAISILLSFATVVAVNFGIFARLTVAGDPAATAHNILANERLFRIGIAGNLLYCVGVLVVVTSLYVVLRVVDRNLALLAAAGRLIHGITWIVATLNLFTALRLLRDPSYLQALGADRVYALARLHLSGFDAYYVGLLFWSLGATIGSVLWLRSRFVPRALAIFGIAASAWCAACTLVFYVVPTFSSVVNLWWFDSPMALFELALSVWLLVKGLR